MGMELLDDGVCACVVLEDVAKRFSEVVVPSCVAIQVILNVSLSRGQLCHSRVPYSL